MADLPKTNAFICLKEILEDFDSTTMGELVTAIEEKGICTVDKYDRVITHVVGSKECEYALDLISEYQDYIRTVEEQLGNIIPSPLDVIPLPNGATDQYGRNFQVSNYNFYGWLETDLPNFSAIPANHIKDKSIGQKSELSYLRIIAALLEYIEGDVSGIEKHPAFSTEAKLIEFLANRYNGYEGLSQSNLSRKFPVAKRALNNT